MAAFYLSAGNSFAQRADSLPHTNITIVYDITTAATKKNIQSGELYNGGIKTVMITKGKARIRLVSLMRIQSQYFTFADSLLTDVLIIKESGKKNYKRRLSPEEWKNLNTKYANLSISLLPDSIAVMGYNCKKAIITLGNGKIVTAYYSTVIKPVDKNIEPLFAGIPGLVLRYEYDSPKGSITCTASKISFEPFDSNIFRPL